MSANTDTNADAVDELEKSLERATAALSRARDMHLSCLLAHDSHGCRAEQGAVEAAERRVNALRHRLVEAKRLAQREMA